MSKYVKIYNEQGIPVGFTECTEEVESTLGYASVVFYDENGLPLGFRNPFPVLKYTLDGVYHNSYWTDASEGYDIQIPVGVNAVTFPDVSCDTELRFSYDISQDNVTCVGSSRSLAVDISNVQQEGSGFGFDWHGWSVYVNVLQE